MQQKPNERVRELRNENRLTQQQFAERLSADGYSVEPDTISKIEQGKRNLSPDIAIQIHQIFNVSLDWLFGLSETRDSRTDDAAAILLNMRKIFKLAPTEITYESKNGLVRYPYFKLSIKKHLYEFLQSVTNAEVYKRDKGLPEEGFSGWIEGSIRKYNDTLKNSETSETIDFVLVDANKLTNEIIGVLCEDAILMQSSDE